MKNDLFKLTVPVTYKASGTVNVKDVLHEFILSLHIYTQNPYADIVVKDDGIYEAYDASYHGSTNYQYRLITDNENKINAYVHANELLKAINAIEKENEEDGETELL